MKLTRNFPAIRILLSAFLLLLHSGQATTAQEKIDFQTTKIWDAAPHNAFTDLAFFDGSFYCVFREATSHVPRNHDQDGKIRLLKSEDGNTWTSVQLIDRANIDLRDPKLSVTPDNRLMILMGGSHYDSGKLQKRTSLVSFLDATSGIISALEETKIESKISGNDDWLWRVTWQGSTGYGIVYQAAESTWTTRLVKTTDGVTYSHVTTLDLPGKPNESTIRFDSRGDMFVVVRNEDGKTRGHLGRSSPPFQDWHWNEIGMRLGGPNFISLPNGNWLMGTRKYSVDPRTILGLLKNDGSYEEIHEFPSGGDTSYPGMLVHDNVVWFSYYSSHEKKSSIYLSRIELPKLMKKINASNRRLVLDRFKPKLFKGQGGFELPYRLLSPALVEQHKDYPLVLFLHGAGERGNENSAQLVHGMADFASDQNQHLYPAFVIAPQCPKEKRWVEVDWSAKTITMPSEPGDTMIAVMELLEHVSETYSIDKKRIYVTGLSMGGYGTWDLMARRPNTFAAALPICGGVDPATAGLVKHIPTWVVHGDRDTAVPAEHSVRMIEALKKAGGEPMFTLMKDTGHNSWSATYSNPEVFEWLFSHSLDEKNR